MDAVVLPLPSTTNQLDPGILPLLRDSEFSGECCYSWREEWISFTSHPGTVPGLAKPRVQETPSFVDLNPPAASLPGWKLEENQ